MWFLRNKPKYVIPPDVAPKPLPKTELSINKEVTLHRIDVTVTYKNGDEVTYYVEERVGENNNGFWYPIVKQKHFNYWIEKIKYCFQQKLAFHFDQMKEKPSVNFDDAREVIFSQPIPVKSDFEVEHSHDGEEWEKENLLRE